MRKKIRIQDIEINIDSQMSAIGYYIKTILVANANPNAESLGDEFLHQYKKLLQEHEDEDIYDLLRYYRLITEFKPALSTILKPGKEFDMCCDAVIQSFNIPLDRIRSQVKENKLPPKKKGPVMPGSSKSMDLRYYCTVCNENLEIPPEKKEKLLNDDEKQELPKHCEKDMVIKITKIQEEKPTDESKEVELKLSTNNRILLKVCF